MSIASKLLGVWAVGKTVSNTTPIMMRLLAGMVAITFFAIFASVLIALLTVGSLWFLYSQMVAHGIDPQIAALMIGCLMLALLSFSMLMLQCYWHRLQRLSKRINISQSPITARVTYVTDAFMDGFFSNRASK